MAGRLERSCSIRRDRIETAQVMLITLMKDVDEVLVRNQQAIRRTGLVDEVLFPAVERLEEMRDNLDLAQRELGIVWKDWQAGRWRSGNS